MSYRYYLFYIFNYLFKQNFFNNITSLHSLLFREIVYWQLPHLSLLHWLIMRVGFEIKESKLESSVKRLNLLNVLIASSISLLQGCATGFSDSLSSLLSSSAGISENSETIYVTENGRDWLIIKRKCTFRNVELNGNFFKLILFCF